MEGLPGGGGACPGSLTIGRIRIKWRFGERAFQVEENEVSKGRGRNISLKQQIAE